jgi:hypothetical protein
MKRFTSPFVPALSERQRVEGTCMSASRVGDGINPRDGFTISRT